MHIYIFTSIFGILDVHFTPNYGFVEMRGNNHINRHFYFISTVY